MRVHSRIDQVLYSLLLLSGLSITSSGASSSSSLAASSSQASCAPPSAGPVHIPIRNVTLSDKTLRRGTAISIGTPNEPFAFAISGALNNTFLQDTSTPSCDANDTRLQCSSEYGGLFDEGHSTTWVSGNYFALDTAAECCADQSADLWGTDTIALNTTLKYQKFPLGIFRGRQNPMNTIGLGRNSTLLNTLVSAKAIASHSFGFFQGWTGAQTEYQTDGALILGGYDEAKITGSNVTLPLNNVDDCKTGLVISVTDVKMNLKNGSDVSILGDSHGSAMRGCIVFDGPVVTFAEDIWWTFTNITGIGEIGRSTSPITYWAMKMPSNDSYDGDLTISIYPNLDIRIPNHQLVRPDVDINDNGQQFISNSSEAVIVLNSLQEINKNDLPLFGMPFLSSAYLMVDNDHGQFTLWKSQQSRTSNIIPMGPPPCSTPSVDSTSQPPPSESAAPPSVPAPDDSKSRVSPGAIAGGVIGGVSAIAVLLGLYFIRRRRRAQRQKAEEQRAAEAQAEMVKASDYSDSTAYWMPEMPSDKQPPQEMPLVVDPGYSVAPYEMQGFEAHEMSATPSMG